MDSFYPSPVLTDVLDSDADGVSDALEILLQLNPQDSSDASKDEDEDRLNIAEEIFLGTSDLSIDTDEDGVTDWDEVFIYKTEPTFYNEDFQVSEDSAAALSSVNAPASVVATSTNLIQGGDFNDYGTALNRGNNTWGIVGHDSWETDFEVQYKNDREYVELSGIKDGNQGFYTGLEQKVDLAPGSYILMWDHSPRNHRKSGTNAYSVDVQIDGATILDALYEHSWADKTVGWSQTALAFTVEPASEGDATERETSIKFIRNIKESQTNGVFLDDITLLPVEVAVDANRNGELEFGIDQTSSDTPYRFWINNDFDTEEDEEGSEGEQPDNADNSIASYRDLEDFSRMWMWCPFSIDDLKSGNIEIGFKWKNHSGAAVNIYLSADSEGGSSYLTDQDAADEQASDIFGGAVAEVTDEEPTYIEADNFLKSGVFENGKLHFIFEGVSEGAGQLVPVLKINGKEVESSTGVWIHLLNVRQMYERVKITSEDPDEIEEPRDIIDSSDPYSLPPEPDIGWTEDPWGNEPVHDPDETEEYVVFVHGWNMTYLDAQKYGETMFKRLWQSGYKGRYSFVRWSTYTGLETYNKSDYRAWKSGKGVALYVNSLSSKYSKNIIAHSMGNIVVGSALREGMKVDNYALLNAAVPAMCYDTNEELYSNSIITPDGDTTDSITKGLGFAGKITRDNVENDIINFYLPNDSALAVWVVSNWIGKPQTYGWDRYEYKPSEPSGDKLRYVDVSLLSPDEYRYLRSFHESVSYVTRSRTRTVGSLGDTNGAITSKVNMADQYDFGAVHSAEWLLRFQKTDRFYYDVMQELNLENAILIP